MDYLISKKAKLRHDTTQHFKYHECVVCISYGATGQGVFRV